MPPETSSRVSPRWEDPRTVAGFVQGSPNANLVAFARGVLAVRPDAACLDIGCGAARNAVPLAQAGFRVTATDLSQPMLDAARERVRAAGVESRVEFALCSMAPLPFADASFDLVVAHGIWNLARSDAEFRAAVAEGARVATPGAGLFLFTFSRRTLADDARPEPGQNFVHSSFNGEPQCFLTEEQILEELGRAGFVRETDAPLAHYNVPAPGAPRRPGPPAIYEGVFTRVGTGPANGPSSRTLRRIEGVRP